jgi:hypothetical protein
VGNWKFAGDKWLNEAQVNGQHFVWNPVARNFGLIGKNYDNILRIGGKDTEQRFTQNRISLRDDVTRSGVRLAGDHVLKMGASLDFLTYESVKNFVGNPVFTFRPVNNFAFPDEVNFGFGDPSIDTDNTQFGGYVQDDWSVGSRLVLNLGLRWDAETNMINNDYVTPQPLRDSLVNVLNDTLFVLQPTGLAPNGDVITRKVRVIDQLGGVSNFVTSGKSDRKMYLGAWQPRVGGSYDLFGNQRTVLFAGFGLYYDRAYWNTLLDEQFRRQFQVLRVNFNSTGATPECPNCVAWNDRFFDPAQLRTLAGTAGLPEVFLVANDLKPPRTNQFSGGVRQQFRGFQMSLSYNGIRGYNGMNFIRAAESSNLGPNYAALFITDDRVKSWYDAMQLQIERPLILGRRWGGSLAYTLARSDQKGLIGDLFWGFDPQFPTVADRPRQRAPNNQAHTITANALTLLPWGFRFSTIVSLGTGLTTNAQDQSGGSAFGQVRTYVYSPPTKPFLGIGHVFSTQNVDMRIEKAFTVANAQNLGIVLDLFNAFNNANWGCYETTILPASGPPNARYGLPGCAGLGRRLQIGLRYGLRPTLQSAESEGGQ